MRALPRACLFGFSVLWGSLASSACKSDESSTVAPASSGSGGTAGLDLGVAEGGAGGSPEEPRAVGCESLVGLDGCGVESVEATFSAAHVLLVIDKSSSMDDQPDGFELRKWQALKAALEPALAAAAPEMSFGLLLYPFAEDADIPLDCFEGCCTVPTGASAIRVGVEPATSSATQIMAALDSVTPGGGTPTAAALEAALTYFTTGEGKGLKGDRFVLLATDGGPNCGASDTVCAADHCTPNLDGLCPANQGNCCAGEGSYCLDDAAVVLRIRALADVGVPTFVIGIPGTERYAPYLSEFATAGGVPHPSSAGYYAVSAEGGVAELTRTFSDITTHLVRSCDVEIGAGAPDQQLINVAVDCNVVPFEDGEGWDILRDSPSTLRLAGEACERVAREGARRIDVVYGCPTVK